MTIREARERGGKTQKELAEVLDISETSYRRLEVDSGRATIEQARRLALALGVSYDVLFFESNSTKGRSKSARREEL